MNFPVPEKLDMEASDIVARWPIWRTKWEQYQAATELDKKSGKTQVSILLTILGKSVANIRQHGYRENRKGRH